MGLTNEFAGKGDALDNPLASDDWFDVLAQNSYDYGDVFPEASTGIQENSSAERDINTSIAINFSEIMADLVNLMSMDKVLELQRESHGPSASEPPSDDSVSSGKRSHDDDAIPDDDFSSSLPDHNYYSLHQKKQKLDDISAGQNIHQMADNKPPQKPVRNSKYFERRKKNNIASKRSRETRKHHFIDMEVQADQLEEENEKLRERIGKLEELTQQMKDVLVKRLSNSGR